MTENPNKNPEKIQEIMSKPPVAMPDYAQDYRPPGIPGISPNAQSAPMPDLAREDPYAKVRQSEDMRSVIEAVRSFGILNAPQQEAITPKCDFVGSKPQQKGKGCGPQ